MGCENERLLTVQDAGVVETTKAGVVSGALSHLTGVTSKPAFVYALVRGFGSNLMLDKRTELARQIYGWSNEMPADHRKPLDGCVAPPMHLQLAAACRSWLAACSSRPVENWSQVLRREERLPPRLHARRLAAGLAREATPCSV